MGPKGHIEWNTGVVTDLQPRIHPVRDAGAMTTAERVRVHATAWAMLGDSHAADDVAQELSLKLEGLDRAGLDPDARRTWIARQAIGLSKNKKRAARRRLHYEWEAGFRRMARRCDPPELDLEREEHAGQVREALGRLPREQREPIVLRYFHGSRLVEIAEHLGLPLSTAHERLQRGLARLRRELREVDVAPALVGLSLPRASVVTVPALVAGRIGAGIFGAGMGAATLLKAALWVGTLSLALGPLTSGSSEDASATGDTHVATAQNQVGVPGFVTPEGPLPIDVVPETESSSEDPATEPQLNPEGEGNDQAPTSDSDESQGDAETGAGPTGGTATSSTRSSSRNPARRPGGRSAVPPVGEELSADRSSDGPEGDDEQFSQACADSGQTGSGRGGDGSSDDGSSSGGAASNGVPGPEDDSQGGHGDDDAETLAAFGYFLGLQPHAAVLMGSLQHDARVAEAQWWVMVSDADGPVAMAQTGPGGEFELFLPEGVGEIEISVGVSSPGGPILERPFTKNDRGTEDGALDLSAF